MISVDNAREVILNSLPVMGVETVLIENSFGRILARDIISKIDVPQINNSAMDGYAVLYETLEHASKDNPVKLRIISEYKAGIVFTKKKNQGTGAIRIMTGAPVPVWCDAVVPVEDTFESEGHVYIMRKVDKNENIRFSGEDIQKGQIVLHGGQRIDSAEIGLCASLNITKIKVFKKVQIGIISTGDEITEVGKPLRKGHIRNSNAYTLMTEVRKAGAVPHYLGIAQDNEASLRKMLSMGMKFDFLITSGGVSMGKYDLLKNVLVAMGAEIIVNSVKMKPGKPFVYAKKGNTSIFSLPGNPVSVMVSFIQFVRPSILRASGSISIFKPTIPALAGVPIIKKSGRREFIRGIYKTEGNRVIVTPIGKQGSGMLSSMSSANCLIDIPEDVTTVKSGGLVYILLFDHEEC